MNCDYSCICLHFFLTWAEKKNQVKNVCCEMHPLCVKVCVKLLCRNLTRDMGSIMLKLYSAYSVTAFIIFSQIVKHEQFFYYCRLTMVSALRHDFDDSKSCTMFTVNWACLRRLQVSASWTLQLNEMKHVLTDWNENTETLQDR